MLKDETIKVEMIMYLEIGGDDQGGDDHVFGDRWR